MDHNFIPSLTDGTKCAKCKYGVIDHTSMATCDSCSRSGNMNVFNDMLLCDDCIQKEKVAITIREQEKQNEKNASRESLADFQARVEAVRADHIEKGIIPEPSGILNINSLIDKAREIDTSLQVRSDVYNAQTIELHKIYAEIDATNSLTYEQKQFKKGEITIEHQKKFQKIVFDANQEVIDGQTRLRVIQQELNKIANTLREEERAKLRIISPDYKPPKVKTPKETVRRTGSKRKTFDKAALHTEVAKLIEEGFPASLEMVQGICVRRDMTPAQAAEVVRKMLAS